MKRSVLDIINGVFLEEIILFVTYIYSVQECFDDRKIPKIIKPRGINFLGA